MEFEPLAAGFANDLALFMAEFSRRGSAIFSTGIIPFAKTILFLTMLWLGIRTIVTRQNDLMNWFPRVTITAVVVAVLLTSPLIVFEAFLWPLQQFVVDAASAFLVEFSPAGAVTPPADYGPIAQLVYLVESMVTWVITLAAKIATNTSWWPSDAAQRLVGAVLLGGPWVWIVVIQCMFLVEAAFVFTLSGIMAPVLLAVYIAPIGRPYLGAQLRALLGAGLTIVFAAVVISFTGFAIQTHQAKVKSLLAPDGGERAAQIAEAEAARDAACADVPTINPIFSGDFDPSKNWIDQWSQGNAEGTAAAEKCNAARKAVADAVDPPFDLFDPYFMQLVVIGIISGLLHVKARTWASNLAGVSDSAGPAAAAATIMTGALGAGWAMSKGLIGRGVGGAGNAVNSLRNSPSSSDRAGGVRPGTGEGGRENYMRDTVNVHTPMAPPTSNNGPDSGNSDLGLGEALKGDGERQDRGGKDE